MDKATKLETRATAPLHAVVAALLRTTWSSWQSATDQQGRERTPERREVAA